MDKALDNVYDVIIVGGGIAGFSAALYTARQGLKTVVISIDVGGQLSYASLLENYPGVESISGLELVLRIQKQATAFGADIIIDEVTSLEKNNDIFIIKTKKGNVYKTISTIIACGKAPKRLGIENEDKYIGKGLSYCSICDAPLYRGKEVALISYGEKGIESLKHLSPIAKTVYYIMPIDKDYNLDLAKELQNTKIYPGYKVIGLKGQNKIEAIVISDKAGNIIKINVDGIFVELGFETRISFLGNLAELNENGEILIDQFGRTKTEGLFAAGDIVISPYKQAVIAAASGVTAALSAINYVYRVKGLNKYLQKDWEKKSKRLLRQFRL